MTWNDAACYLLVGALCALLAYAGGQLLMMFVMGGV